MLYYKFIEFQLYYKARFKYTLTEPKTGICYERV
jgi:hypothetical protein